MVCPAIDPHWNGAARFGKPKALVEANGVTVRREHYLMKVSIFLKHCGHQFAADAPSLKVRMHKQMGKINDQVPVRNSICQSDQQIIGTCRYQSVRVV